MNVHSFLLCICLNIFLFSVYNMMRNFPPVFSQHQDLVMSSDFQKIHRCEIRTRSVGHSAINISRSVCEVGNHSLKLTYYIWLWRQRDAADRYQDDTPLFQVAEVQGAAIGASCEQLDGYAYFYALLSSWMFSCSCGQRFNKLSFIQIPALQTLDPVTRIRHRHVVFTLVAKAKMIYAFLLNTFVSLSAKLHGLPLPWGNVCPPGTGDPYPQYFSACPSNFLVLFHSWGEAGAARSATLLNKTDVKR